MPEAHSPASPIAAPDWSSQSEQIPCPLCGYNLRGLTEPRCPECGYRFNWPEVLDPNRRLHRYLFEHHPESNVRSFIRTAIGQLMPRRFWRSVRPQMPSSTRRLMIYWIVLVGATLSCFLAFLCTLGIEQFVTYHRNRPELIKALQSPADDAFRVDIVSQYGSIEAYADFCYPKPFSRRFFRGIWLYFTYAAFGSHGRRPVGLFIPVAIIYWVWPWMTLLVMRIFRVSMRRARIQSIHVLRVLIYASDTALWFVALCFAALVCFSRIDYARLPAFYWWWAHHQRPTILLALVCLTAITMYRVAIGFKLYLRFDHSLATVLASQVIVLLVVLAALIYIPGVWAHVMQCVIWP
jgi:hypothetical protein